MGREKTPADNNRSLVKWCDKKLLAEYGDKVRPEKRPDPIDELVLTVLSQNTNDVNRDRAYQGLRARFPSWEEVMAAPVEQVEEAIRVGGLARQKSARIKQMLVGIREREGSLSLRRICGMPLVRAREYLHSFKGVGDKTAAIVLLFCCGKPVFPVDTHIHRISKRLGLAPEKADAAKAHRIMGEIVPEGIMYRLHINMIQHGRKICRARKPDCGACCLKAKCPSAGKWR